MGDYSTGALTTQTWDAFEELCLRNNGAGMGDCWCCWFHNVTAGEKREAGGGDWRAYKKRRVAEGNAHAALVFDDETAVGWCEYGPPRELPGIFHRKEVEFEGAPVPDYRLTCFFVDRRHRRDGSPGRCARADRRSRWWPCRDLPAGQCRCEGHRVVPIQRHQGDVRARRLQLRTSEGQEPLRDAQNSRLSAAPVNEDAGPFREWPAG